MMNPSEQPGHKDQHALFSDKVHAPFSTHPSSYGQRALWYIEQTTSAMSAYNVVFPVRIRAPLDIPALQRVIQRLSERHTALRTTFAATSERVVQQIRAHADAHFEIIDATGGTEDDLAAQVAIKQDLPFDLASGPLMRTYLFVYAPEDYILLMMWHHTVIDGWSVGLLARELHTLYLAETGGPPARLAPPAMQYSAYVDWQDTMLAGPEGARLRRYWHEQLSGELPVLNLLTDYPRPALQTFRGATCRIDLAPHLFQQLRDLAHATRTTLFAILLTGYKVLLHRYTGQEDIIVGAPFAVRSRAEFRRTVGYLVNLVAIRTRLAGTTSFRHLLADTHRLVQAAQNHQDYPFPLLVEELKPARDPGRSAIIETTFTLQKGRRLGVTADMDGPRQETGDQPALPMEPYPLLQQNTPFDLMVDAFELGQTLHLVMHYNTDLFAPATIERMLGHFHRLLEELVANPDQPIGALPLLTPAEQQMLLVEWNATHTPYPADQCVHDLISDQAAHTPEAVAVVYQDQRLTYRELNRRANQLAHHLRGLGVGPDRLVGVYLDRSLDLLVAVLGIWKAGGAYLPLDPTFPRERLAMMLNDAAAPVLLTQADIQADAPAHTGQVVCIDTDWSTIARQPATFPAHAAQPGHLAYVIYTSGSTGRPKGVMIEHRSVLNLATGLQRAIYAQHPQRPLRVSLNAALSFDASVQQLTTLLYGHTLYLIPEALRRDGPALLDYIRVQRLDVLDCVPTQLKLLLEAGLLDAAEWVPSIILPGGEAIDAATWQTLARAPTTACYNMYGPTECTVDATTAAVGPVPEQPTIGRPLANTRLYILDRNMQPVPIGVPGELYIGGAGVARGYLNRPELTAERFVANPFESGRLYRTGDLARYLPDGNVEFIGRTDHQVKIRGFRIELGEIEAVLREHPAVREAVIVDGPAPGGGRRLLAYLTAAGEQPPASSELRRHLRARLPDYMVPAFFTTLAAIPLTPNGKVDRRALPTPEQTRATGKSQVVAPSTAMERIIAQVWQEALGIEQIGVHDTFFDLGGHSLLAVQIMTRVEQQTGIKLNPAILRAHTLGQIAAMYTEQQNNPQDNSQDNPQPQAPEQEHLAKRMRGVFKRLVTGRQS